MRQERLMALTWGGASLSRTEIYFGFHFCWEWDGLAVGPCSEEWGDGMSCRCGHTLPISLREQRRARKAAKNRAMTKQFGWRPWRDPSWIHIIEPLCQPLFKRLNGLGQICNSTVYWHEARMEYLREPSGFVSMSRVAEEMRLTKAHTPDFVDEAVTYTSEQLKAIETWIRETWGDLKPDVMAEKLGRGEL